MSTNILSNLLVGGRAKLELNHDALEVSQFSMKDFLRLMGFTHYRSDGFHLAPSFSCSRTNEQLLTVIKLRHFVRITGHKYIIFAFSG